MASIPLKPQYGPTLGRLLSPAWQAARPLTRVLLTAVGVVLLALMLAAVLSLLDASYSHGGAIPFSFRYRGLYRATPEPGDYVRVVRDSGGRLEDSFAVAPLAIPSYTGSSGGELPLLAATYAVGLQHRSLGFRLQGEGRAKISSTLTGYDIRYSAIVEGLRTYGRDVILLPSAHARQGLVVKMLTRERTSVAKPVATQGVLEKPLKTLSVG